MPRLPLLLALAACAAPLDTDPVVDDTGATAEELPDGPACDGTLTLELDAVPDPLRTREPWTEAGATLELDAFGPEIPQVFAPGNGCIDLFPAELNVALAGTGCAGNEVTFVVTDKGRNASVRAGATLGGALAGENRVLPAQVGEEVELVVRTGDAFLDLVVGGLDASVCRIVVQQVPIPERFQPEDTGDDF